ncbi:MAG: alpha/beta fold hydrolase, partial [Candidatus Wenzhouxiangella sp. M2_3B_020]
MYAMLYATAHPDRVSHLLLSASGGATRDWLGYVGANIRKHMGPERRAVFDRYADAERAGVSPEVANRRRVEAMAAAYVYDPENIPFVVEALTREGANFPAVRAAVYADLERIEYDLLDELETLEVPALILHGRQDLLGERVPLQTHAALPDSELVWLEQCAHYPWLDAPDAYFGAIERFLSPG